VVVGIGRNDEEDIERYCQKKYDTIPIDRKNLMGVKMVGLNHIGHHYD